MAGDVVPGFDPGPHLAVRLGTGVFIHAIRSSMISSTVLPRFAFCTFSVAERLGNVLTVPILAFQAHRPRCGHLRR